MNEQLKKEQFNLNVLVFSKHYSENPPTDAEILKQSQVVDKLMAEEMERMNERGD